MTESNSEMGFVEPETDFAEDDIFYGDIGPTNGEELTRSYLERDNFEREWGCTADDPFAEDFTEISQHDIVEVIAHGDRVGRPIIVVYAYRLPSNKTFDHQKFLRYLQFTLDKVVELDYTIIYCHYGLRSNNKPPLRWLFQAYSILDRKYKKNLKALFLVHPTRFIRVLWGLFKPFISIKFEKKIHYVNYLNELNAYLRVEQLNLPQPVKDHDKMLQVASKSITRETSFSKISPSPPRPTQQFNVPLSFILSHNPDYDVPPLVTDLISFMSEHSLNVEGLFRRSAEVSRIKRLQERIDKGEKINFLQEEEYDGNIVAASIDASVLLKTFLRALGEPVVTNALYPDLVALASVSKEDKLPAICAFVRLLPPENYLLLKTVCQFLTKVAACSDVNKMTASNLSVVFGPNLTWPTDQQVPMTQLNNLNNFCYRLIVDFETVFEEN
ncbi:unnamed protein product [Enterobius vermicularis]|uniref:Rho GTPase-activating protein 68F n=1 Tax=Enterobius vermicularis TaxID=51028 RepID=A0A0N4V274_ENTVE|nr:unnamed protein product [Enterobius vermicularis]